MDGSEEKFISLINNSKGIEKIRALLRYANFKRQSDWQISLEVAKEAYEMSLQLKDDEGEVEALICMAYAHYYHSDFPEAEQLADKLHDKGTDLENHSILCHCYTIKGRIAYTSSEPSQALEFYLKALEHSLKDPKPLNLMTCYNNLGTGYQEVRNFKEALTYFQLAMDEAEKMNYPGKEIFHMNLGCIQYAQKDYKAALASFIRVSRYFEENNQLTYLSDSYLNIGSTYYILDNITLGNEFLEKSCKLKEKLKDFKGLSNAYQVVGDTFLNMGEKEKAFEYYQRALEIANEHNILNERIKSYQSLGKYWEEQENYQKLSEIRNILLELTEENYKKIHDDRISDMETKYKTEIYKLQTRELNEKNKAMQEQIEKLKAVHDQLKAKVEDSVRRINEQGNLLTSQSRMALMGEMVSMIAHQWRQPLNVISVLVQSFEDAWEFDEMNADYIEKQVKLVMDQIFYMSETINDFRNFFKSESQGEFDLKHVLEKALGLLDYMLKQTNISRTTDLAEDCLISGNPNEIIQVVMNIINNARDAMLEDKIESPMIKISLNKTSDNIEMSIFNKGNQIPEHVRIKLFEPYFSTKGEKGTGIGLYICKMIIENKYHGTIEALNRDDGVEFVIRL
ncbi:MAG: tetratricopeptide repeat protein [Candidatus Cloacimonetes bacterium]|nr:tetratricopeptide repeat protein [Candidatus Cloacimonadota bacterium]